MNALQKYILGHNLDPRAVMDRLQECHVIADECVNPADVEREDAERAVEWLKENK